MLGVRGQVWGARWPQVAPVSRCFGARAELRSQLVPERLCHVHCTHCASVAQSAQQCSALATADRPYGRCVHLVWQRAAAVPLPVLQEVPIRYWIHSAAPLIVHGRRTHRSTSTPSTAARGYQRTYTATRSSHWAWPRVALDLH